MTEGGGGDVLIDALGNDGLLKLPGRVELEEVTSSQGEGHALVVGLEVVVDLGEDEGGELSFGEALVLVQGLAGMCVRQKKAGRRIRKDERARGGPREREEDWPRTHIWLREPATSVQTVSMSSLRAWRANTLSSGSSSARKPRTPAAVTRPGILGDVTAAATTTPTGRGAGEGKGVLGVRDKLVPGRRRGETGRATGRRRERQRRVLPERWRKNKTERERERSITSWREIEG